MAVVLIIVGLIGLLFNIVLSNLQQSRDQANFFLEAQRIVNALNERLVSAVWTDGPSMGFTDSATRTSFRVAIYNPVSLTLQYRTVSFNASDKTLRIDDRTLLKAGPEVESIFFGPGSSRSGTLECVLIHVRPNSSRLRSYVSPILTYLTASY